MRAIKQEIIYFTTGMALQLIARNIKIPYVKKQITKGKKDNFFFQQTM